MCHYSGIRKIKGGRYPGSQGNDREMMVRTILNAQLNIKSKKRGRKKQ